MVLLVGKLAQSWPSSREVRTLEEQIWTPQQADHCRLNSLTAIREPVHHEEGAETLLTKEERIAEGGGPKNKPKVRSPGAQARRGRGGGGRRRWRGNRGDEKEEEGEEEEG